MEEFKTSREPQAATDFRKNQPSVLDLIFCYECGETFGSKKEEDRHQCGSALNNSSDFEFPDILPMVEDESETKNISSSTISADEDGKYH